MNDQNSPINSKIKLGVSACLLGENVRYSGQHAKDDYVAETLSDFFEWVPVCPEVEVGMGTPRETVHLEGSKDHPRMVGSKTQKDWTEPMQNYARNKSQSLLKENICGYIFKKNSPSCGPFRVKIQNPETGYPSIGEGLFVTEFRNAHVLAPIEDEGRLRNPRFRDNFIERVFAYARLKQLIEGPFSRKKVVEFHSCHKYQLMAHSVKHYRELGKMVAHIKDFQPDDFVAQYSVKFMEGLAVLCTPKKHANVLEHILGYLRGHIDDIDRQELKEQIHLHRQEQVPLIVPITLVAHYVRKHKIEYIQNQYYLNPHPRELMLRNRV